VRMSQVSCEKKKPQRMVGRVVSTFKWLACCNQKINHSISAVPVCIVHFSSVFRFIRNHILQSKIHTHACYCQ